MTKYSFQELAWSVGVPKVAREVLLQVPELIAKAVDEEREACAKVCESEMKAYSYPEYTTDPLGGIRERFAAQQCANAIRKRSDK